MLSCARRTHDLVPGRTRPALGMNEDWAEKPNIKWTITIAKIEIVTYLLSMSRQTLAKESLPDSAAAALVKLGQDIRTARKRRGITAADLATRAFTNRQTLRRLEKGYPGVSLSVLAHVLWVLQLENNLSMAVDPQNDRLGTVLSIEKLPRHVGKKRKKTQAQELLNGI